MKKIWSILMLALSVIGVRAATVTYNQTNGQLLYPTGFFRQHIIPGQGMVTQYGTGSNTLTLYVLTNSPSSPGMLPPWQTNALWSNGTWEQWSNLFRGNSNVVITQTPTGMVFSLTNVAASSSGMTIESTPATNLFSFGIIDLDDFGGGNWGIDINNSTIGTNKWTDAAYNWVLSLGGAGGGTTNGFGVNGVYRTDWNFLNSAVIVSTTSGGTNFYLSIVDGSIGTNKFDTTAYNLLITDTVGLGTNALVNGIKRQPFALTNNPGTGGVIWVTNASGEVLAYATNIASGGGGGGLGTNFVLNGTLMQPAIITNGLSVVWSTNASGHIQAAVSLVDSNIPSTIARLESPVFTGTVTFSNLFVSNLQIPFASRYVWANGSSNLAATSDGQSWTNLNGSSIATGTVADARLDPAVARLASPTFTGDPKVPTATPGDNDTSAASTAFVTAAVAAGGGSGGTGTVVTASGGSDMSRANITTNGFGLLVTQSGTNILLSTTNNYPAGYYAGGFLPLFAGVSNALTGDLSMDQSSDVRLFMSETSRMLTDGYEVMGLRAYNGKLALHSFATNDLSAAEEFMVIDPTDTTGPTDIITFPNSGFNNKVVFEADVEFNGTTTFSGTTTFNNLAIGTVTVVTNLTVPNNPYGAGWNGSTNVPNENSVYDEMELRAPKASPAFTTSATIGGTNILDYAAMHLTEAEASALYHQTNSTLTRVAGIGAGTTGDLLYRDATGWTNLAKGTQGQFLAVTATVPAWSNAPAWDGSPIESGTITNISTTRINGVVPVQQEKGALFWDFISAPPFMTAIALSLGASFPTTGTTNDPFALIAQTGGSSANSGHGYYTGASSYNVAGGEEWEFGWYIHKTNNVGFRTGLLDVLSATAAATDGIYIEQQTNGTYRGVSVANASLSATASSYVPVEDSTIQYKGTWAVAANPTNVVYTIYTNGVLAWTDTVSANIPTNSARLTGLGFFSWHGGSGSGTNLIRYGWLSFKPAFSGSR